MADVNIEGLSLGEDREEEGFCFDLDEEGDEVGDLSWCLVGRFLCDRPIHLNSMRSKVADIWSPVKGVSIKKADEGLFIFNFDHVLDMEAVLTGGAWTFDNNLLIVERVKIGVQIENIPLFHVTFWIQVHNLPAGMMLEKVGKALGNFAGSFVEYDRNNNTSFWRKYMRLRVRIDVRQSLKKGTKVKNKGGEWCNVLFKYERLGMFCFVCGILGHTEAKCEVKFSMTSDDGKREWSSDLRADNKRSGSNAGSKWLKDDSAGIGKSIDGESRSEESVEPTETAAA
ncbi:uncharacterized protein At4g02000-like [Vicia villosa]|uniref:uncharacterized protein At4g02000-like n=1 Tax=Vicia villosa TaxID=3911 RepID=UPI00273B2DF8|nr:uncharacterized protein At4g02000-like [Vicia villosa]